VDMNEACSSDEALGGYRIKARHVTRRPTSSLVSRGRAPGAGSVV
jgi:hypothetical protein